jgi:DNA topoisomerase-1
MKDKLVADAVKHLLTLPGDRLMQYHVDNTKRSIAPMNEDGVNKYLRPFGITAKNFRTFHATMLAKELLDDAGAPKDNKDAAKKITAVVKQVAAKLGNTPAVCKSSYISPAVLADYARSVV